MRDSFFSFCYLIILHAESELPNQEVDINYFIGNNYLRPCVNDMRTSPPPIRLKSGQNANLNEICVINWNLWKNNFPTITIFIFWDIVEFVLKILRNKISRKVANFFCPKRCTMFWNVCKNDIQVFIFWDMTDFVFWTFRIIDLYNSKKHCDLFILFESE